MALDMNKVLKKAGELEDKQSRGSSTGAKFLKLKDGDNQVRILTGWTTEGDFAGQFWREVAQHWRVSETQKGPVLCPKQTPFLNGDCPICDLVAKLKSDKGNIRAQEVVKDIRAKTAFMLNVVDLADAIYTASDVAEYKKTRPDGDVPFEVGETKVQVYAAPSTVFGQILNTIKVNKTDVTDPKDGHDVTISKSGKGLNTRYQVAIVLKPSPAPDAPGVALDQVGFVMDSDAMLDLLTEGVGGEFVNLLPKGVGAPTEQLSQSNDAAGDLKSQLFAAMRK